mgnify:CR=1 FL=1
MWVFYHKIFAVTFDENFAKATGTKTDVYNLLIAVITAVIIVLAMNLVGSLLISALIIFPALSAMRIYKRFRAVIIFSAILSVVCAVFWNYCFYTGRNSSWLYYCGSRHSRIFCNKHYRKNIGKIK